MIIETLKEFGFSEKEAKVYLALLKLEVATVSSIAEEAGINRSLTYVIINSLRKKGYVVNSGDLSIQRFSAVSPEILSKISTDRLNQSSDLAKKIESLLPELKALHKETRHKPKVYIYEGERALRLGLYEIFNEQASKGMKIYRVYANLADFFNNKYLPKNYTIKDDVAVIKKAGVEMRVITPSDIESAKIVEEYKKHGSKDKFLLISQKRFDRLSDGIPAFSIYENKVDFFSTDGSLVVIESKEIAATLRNMFDLAWEAEKGKIK